MPLFKEEEKEVKRYAIVS